jgi:signal transduction histidine kinase
VAALRQDAQRLAPPGLATEVAADERLTALSAAVEVAAYRIGLEALTNSARHAHATRVVVELRRMPDMLLLRIHDDGRGLRGGEPPGVGLSSMRERAEELGGSLEVAATPGGGTTVTARLPLGEAPRDA